MRILAALVFLAMAVSAACSSAVETVNHGVILCDVEDDCDDDNDCTDDVCANGRCRFFWMANDVACVPEDGGSGTCTAGVCGY